MIELALFLRLLDDRPQVSHPRQHCRYGDELRFGVHRDQPGQGGLARAGRAGEKDRGKQLVRFDRPSKQLPRGDDLLLPDEFIQALRAHPCCQGRLGFHPLVHGVIKQVHPVDYIHE